MLQAKAEFTKEVFMKEYAKPMEEYPLASSFGYKHTRTVHLGGSAVSMYGGDGIKGKSSKVNSGKSSKSMKKDSMKY